MYRARAASRALYHPDAFKVDPMTGNSESQSSQNRPSGNGGNRVVVILVALLGLGVVLAFLFVGGTIIFRLLSGSEPTSMPEATLRPTFTPVAMVTAETPASAPTVP